MAKSTKAAKPKGKASAKAGAPAPKPGKGNGSRKRNAVIAALHAVEGRGAQAIEWWPIQRLIPYPGNAKLHPPETVTQVAQGIADLGFNNPILVDSKNVILAGHGRRLAAMLLGLEKVPVVVLKHLTPAEARRYRLEDNYLGMLSGWDPEAFRKEVMGARAEGNDIVATWSAADLAKALKSGDFLDDLIGGEQQHDDDTSSGVALKGKGVSLKFDMLPADRDVVVAWLGRERERLKVRTAAEVLVKLARAK